MINFAVQCGSFMPQVSAPVFSLSVGVAQAWSHLSVGQAIGACDGSSGMRYERLAKPAATY